MKISQQRIRYLAKLISAIDPNHKIKIKLEKVESIDESTYEQFSRSTFSSNIDFPSVHIPEESHVDPGESGVATPPIFICEPDETKLKIQKRTSKKPELMSKMVSPLRGKKESDRSPTSSLSQRIGGESTDQSGSCAKNAPSVSRELDDQHARSFFEKVSAELVDLESGVKDKKMKKRGEKADRKSDDKSKGDKLDITEEWNVFIAPKPAKNSRSSSTSDLGGVTSSTESTPKLQAKYHELGSKASSLFDLWIVKGGERSSSADSTPKPKPKRDGKSPGFRDLTDSSIESSPVVPNRKKDKKMVTPAIVAEPNDYAKTPADPNKSCHDLEETLERVMIITKDINDIKVAQEERSTKITDGDDNLIMKSRIFSDETDSQPPVAPPRKKKLQKRKQPESGAVNLTADAEKVLKNLGDTHEVVTLGTTCTTECAISKGSDKNVQNQIKNVDSQQIQEMLTDDLPEEKDSKLRILEKYPGTSTEEASIPEQLSRGKSSRKSKKKINNQLQAVISQNNPPTENLENLTPFTPVVVNEDLLLVELKQDVTSQMTIADGKKETDPQQIKETSSDHSEGDSKPKVLENESTESAFITEQLSRGKYSRKSKKKINNQLQVVINQNNPPTENLENLTPITPGAVNELLELKQDVTSQTTIADGKKETDFQQVKGTSSDLSEGDSKPKVLENESTERAFITEQLSRGKSPRESKKKINNQSEALITSGNPSTENLENSTQSTVAVKENLLDSQQDVPSQMTFAEGEKEKDSQQVEEASSSLPEGDSKLMILENESTERAFISEPLSRRKYSRKSKKKTNNKLETVSDSPPENHKNSTQSTPAVKEDFLEPQQDVPSQMTFAEETDSQKVKETFSDFPDKNDLKLQILESAPETSAINQTVISEEFSRGKLSRKSKKNQSESAITFTDPPTENLDTLKSSIAAAGKDIKSQSSVAADEEEIETVERNSRASQSIPKITDNLLLSQTNELKRNKPSRKSKKGNQNVEKDTLLPEISHNVKKSSDEVVQLEIIQVPKKVDAEDDIIPLEKEAKALVQSSKEIPSEESKAERIEVPAQKLSNRGKPTEKGSAIPIVESESVIADAFHHTGLNEPEHNLPICASTNQLLETTSPEEVKLTDHNEANLSAAEGSTSLIVNIAEIPISMKETSRKSKKKDANRSTSKDLTEIENKTPKEILEPTPNLSAPALLLKNSSQLEGPVPQKNTKPADSNENTPILEEIEFPQKSAASLSLSILQNMTEHINEVKNMLVSKKMEQDESLTPSSDFCVEEEVAKICQQFKYQNEAHALTPEGINLFNTEFKYKKSEKIENEDEKQLPSAAIPTLSRESEAINEPENQPANKRNKKKSKKNIAQENESRVEPEKFDPFVDRECNRPSGIVPRHSTLENDSICIVKVSAEDKSNKNEKSFPSAEAENVNTKSRKSRPTLTDSRTEVEITELKKEAPKLRDLEKEKNCQHNSSEQDVPTKIDQKFSIYEIGEIAGSATEIKNVPKNPKRQKNQRTITKDITPDPQPEEERPLEIEACKAASSASLLGNKIAKDENDSKLQQSKNVLSSDVDSDETRNNFKQYGLGDQEHEIDYGKTLESVEQTGLGKTKKNKKPTRNQSGSESHIHDKTQPEELVIDYKIIEEVPSCDLVSVAKCDPEKNKNTNSKKTKRNQTDKQLKPEESPSLDLAPISRNESNENKNQTLGAKNKNLDKSNERQKELELKLSPDKVQEDIEKVGLPTFSRNQSKEDQNQAVDKNKNLKKSKGKERDQELRIFSDKIPQPEKLEVECKISELDGNQSFDKNKNLKKSKENQKDQELKSSPSKIQPEKITIGQGDIEKVDLPAVSRNESKKDRNQSVEKSKENQKDRELKSPPGKIQPEKITIGQGDIEKVDLPASSRNESKDDENQSVDRNKNLKKSKGKQRDQELRISSDKIPQPEEMEVECEISGLLSISTGESKEDENQSVDKNKNLKKSKEKQKDQELSIPSDKIPQIEEAEVKYETSNEASGSDLSPTSRNESKEDQNQAVEDKILKKSKRKQKYQESRISSDKIPQPKGAEVKHKISEEASDSYLLSISKGESQEDENQTVDRNKNLKKFIDPELRISSDKIPQPEEAEMKHEIFEEIPASDLPSVSRYESKKDGNQAVDKNKDLKKSKGKQKDQQLRISSDKIPQPEEVKVEREISELLSISRTESKEDQNLSVDKNKNLKKSKEKQKDQELRISSDKIPQPEEAEVKHESSEEALGSYPLPISRDEPKEDENQTVDKNKNLKKFEDLELRISCDKPPQPEEAEMKYKISEEIPSSDLPSVFRYESNKDENQTVDKNKNFKKSKGKQKDQEVRVPSDKILQLEEAVVEHEITDKVSSSDLPSVSKDESKKYENKTIDESGDLKKSKDNQKEKELRKSTEEPKIIEGTPDLDLAFVSRDKSHENKNQMLDNKSSKKSRKSKITSKLNPPQLNCEDQKSESCIPILEPQSRINAKDNETEETGDFKQTDPKNSDNCKSSASLNESSLQIEECPDLTKESIVENVEKRDDVSSETQVTVQTKVENESTKSSTHSPQEEFHIPKSTGLDIDSEPRGYKSNNREASTAKKNGKIEKPCPNFDEYTIRESKENNVKMMPNDELQIKNSENMTSNLPKGENMTEMTSNILKESKCVPNKMSTTDNTKNKSRKSKNGKFKSSLLNDEVSNLSAEEVSSEKELSEQKIVTSKDELAEGKSTCSILQGHILETDDTLSKQLENPEIDSEIDKNDQVKNKTKMMKKTNSSPLSAIENDNLSQDKEKLDHRNSKKVDKQPNKQNVQTESKGATQSDNDIHIPLEVICAVEEGTSTMNEETKTEDVIKQDGAHPSQQKSRNKIQINQTTTSKSIESKKSSESRKNKKTKRVHFDENLLQLTKTVGANDMEQNSEVFNEFVQGSYNDQIINQDNEIFKNDEYDGEPFACGISISEPHNESLSTFHDLNLVDPPSSENKFLDEDESCVENLKVLKNEEIKSDEASGIEHGISTRAMKSLIVENKFQALLDASEVKHKDNLAEEKGAEKSSEIPLSSWTTTKRGRKKKSNREIKNDTSADIIKGNNVYKILNEISNDNEEVEEEAVQSTHLFLKNADDTCGVNSNSSQMSFDDHTLLDHSHVTLKASYEKLNKLNERDVASPSLADSSAQMKRTTKSKKNMNASIEDSIPWPKEFSDETNSSLAIEISNSPKPSINLPEFNEKVIKSMSPQLPNISTEEIGGRPNFAKQMRPQKTKSNRARLCSFNQMSVTRDDILEDCIDASSSSLLTHSDHDKISNQQSELCKNNEVLPESTDSSQDNLSKKKKKLKKVENTLAPSLQAKAGECRDDISIAPGNHEEKFDHKDLPLMNFQDVILKNTQDKVGRCDESINAIACFEPSEQVTKIKSKSTHICGTSKDQTSITPNKLFEKENTEDNFSKVLALRPSMTVMKWEEPFSIVDQVSHSLAQFHVKPSGEVVREFPRDLTEGKGKVISFPLDRKTDDRNSQRWFKEDSSKSDIWGRPSAWFTIESNYSQQCVKRESGQLRESNTEDSYIRNLDERKGSKNWSKFSCSEFMDVPLTDANEQHLMHNAGSHSNWNLALEEAAVKKIKEEVADLKQASDTNTSNQNDETLQKILKNLEVQERAGLALEDKLSVLSDFEEYNTLMSELSDIKSNIYTLKSSISLQLDLNQCKVQSQNQRNADLFKCSEVIATVSSWITTVELKLASDEDIYLSNAKEEKESYNILSQELKSHASKLQRCSCVCNTYLRSGDNDVSVKSMFDTLEDLATKVDQLKCVIEEKRQAIQVKPSPTVPEFAEMSSKEVQTAGDSLSNKEIQTSLKDPISLFENAGVQTSNVEDLSTDCSEDLSTFNEDPSTSTLSNIDDIEVPIVELMDVRVARDPTPVHDTKTHVKLSDLEPISPDRIQSSVVDIPHATLCADENIVKKVEFSKQSAKLIRRDTFTVIDDAPPEKLERDSDQLLRPSLDSTFDPIVSHDLAGSSVPSTSTQPISPLNFESPQKLGTLILGDSSPPKSRLTRQGTFTFLESDLDTRDDPSQITTSIDPSAEEDKGVTLDQENIQSPNLTALDTIVIDNIPEVPNQNKPTCVEPDQNEAVRAPEVVTIGNLEEEMAYKQLQSTDSPKNQDYSIDDFGLQNSPKSKIKSVIEPISQDIGVAVEPIITSVEVSLVETMSKNLQAEDKTDQIDSIGEDDIAKTETRRLNKGVQFEKTTADQESQVPDPDLSKVEKCDKAIGTKDKSHKKKIRRRSDTTSFTELTEPLAVEETVVPAIEEEMESTVPGDIWADACDRINKRIHYDNAFCNLSFQEPEAAVGDVKTVTQMIKKMTPYKSLDGSKFVECAEGISVLLENLKKQIFLLQQSTHFITPEEQIGKLNAVKAAQVEIDESCLQPLLSLSDKIACDLPQGDAENCRILCQMLKNQSSCIDEIHQLNHDRLANIINQWKHLMEQILEVDQLVLDLEMDLQKMVDNSEGSLQERLDILEKFDNTREDLTTRLLEAMSIAEEVLISAPQYSVPDAAHTAYQRLKHIQSNINDERVKLLQNMSLVKEYEKILDDFVQIMDIAEELLVLPISVCSLTHLQEDMRSRHRFFIDLNHCKTILESSEGHVNDGTCQKYLEAHSQSVERASDVLERAKVFSQQMALAVSKWASINEGMADESGRLEVLQNQFPDLKTTTSNDYPQRIDRLRSLAVDVYQNMARISQLTDSAHGLRKIITSPELECGYDKYKEQAVQVYNDVNNHLNALQLFEENFTQFETKKGKVITWICETEFLMKDLESEMDMKKLWGLQAEFEVYSKMKDASCEHFDIAERTLKLVDGDVEKASLEEFQERWQKLACQFQELQNQAFETSNMTIDDLPSFFQTVSVAIDDLPDTIENEEQFHLYSNNIQAIQKALQQSKEKLTSSKPKTESESARIKALIQQMRKMKCKIDKEAENALTFEYYIGEINEKIRQVNRELSRSNTALAQYESALNLWQDDVIQASNSCEVLDDELETISDTIATLYQMFHNPPRCMTVVVSLPIIERNVTLIKNKYEDLETRCKSLLNLLRVQMELWKDFTDQLRKVDESVEEVGFMTDLMRLHGTVDYQRLATVTDNLHDLSENFKQREPDLLHGLNGAADRVKAVCSPDISDEIDRTVGGSVEAWSKSNKSLRDLCDRYKRALDLWGVYRKNCDLVNLWVESQSLTKLPAEETRHQLQVYELAVHEQYEKLVELRGMVIEIASEIGVNENNLLADEIVLLSKKLEDVKSTLTMLNNVTVSEKHKVYFEELSQTENYISSVKEDLQTTENGEIRTVEQVQELRLHLESLTKTDTVLNGMRTKQGELLSNLQTPVHQEDLRIVELLESWQEVFRETFQQYHRVFSSIAGDQDSQEAMKLWMDYLTSIEEFLSTKIPDSYDCLSNDEHLCQMHENVLTSQNAILLGEKTDSHSDMSERLKLLTTRHDETLSKIKGRHDQVKKRLDLWQLYRNEQKKLLLWLGRVENEQSQLNLRYRYLHVRTLTTNLNKIEDLLDRIPQGDKLVLSLRSQHKNLLSGCGSVVSTSVRMELDAADQRIRNLEAALRTWHDFLAKMRDSIDLDEKLAQHIDDIFSKIQTAIVKEKDVCDRVTYAIPVLENSLQLMKNFKEELSSMDGELVQLTHIEASLKETIDTKDAKFIKQRNWLLRQRQEDIKYQLVSVIFQLEDRLALWERFCQRRLNFITWTDKLYGRLEGFSTSLSYPEVALRRLELEFCGEVDAKRVEFDWLVETGLRLAGYENDQQPERFTNMSEKVEEVRHVWEKVNQDTKGEVEKVKRIIKEMKTLKLDTRQLLSWMQKMFNDLSKMVSFDKYDNDAILKKLDEHKVIDEEIGLRSSDVTDLINRSDMFLMDCHNCNISLDIKSFMLNFDSLERKWELLRIECGETKNHIYTTWKMIQDICAICEREEPWLTAKEKQLDDVREKGESDTLSDKHSLILEANIMLASIQEHAPSFKLLEELYLEVLAKNEITEIPEVDDLLKRFAAFRNAVPKWRDEIDEDVRIRREFEAGHASLILNLTQLNARLTQLQHLNAAKVENRSAKFKELLTEHIALKSRVEQVDSLKVRLLSDETQTDVDGVEKLAYEYTSMYEDIDKRFKMLKKMFQKPSPTKKLSVNEEVQVDTLKFVNDFAAQVETLPKSLLRQDAFLFDLQHMIKETRENIDKLADLVLMTNNYEEIAKVYACCQSSVDLMTHYTKELESQATVSSRDGILEEARELAKTFQRMTEKVHFKQQHRMDTNSELGRLRCPECSERNWSQLDTDIWRMEKWLDEAEGTLRASSIIPPSNIEELEDVIIREHKEFMVYLESHRDVINSLNLVGEHLTEHSSSREQLTRVRERLHAVNERWRKIEARANIWRTSLRRSLIENPEFSHVITELLEWMDVAEESIRSCEPIDITEDESVVRGKYDKFKKLRREFQKYELRVASLQEANRVCAQERLREFEYLDDRLHRVWLRLESLIRLTRLYMLKLGTGLGYNTSELFATLDLNDAATTTTPDELPNESAIDPMSQTDAPSSSPPSEDETRSILTRGRRIVGRVFRATIPIQAFLLVLMGMASLYPNHKDEYSCATANNLAWSLQPLLRYPDGPPPT